jgi:hypothetical protein
VIGELRTNRLSGVPSQGAATAGHGSADAPRSSHPSDPWAANALAVCGGLLILASVLYVVVDVIMWL